MGNVTEHDKGKAAELLERWKAEWSLEENADHVDAQWRSMVNGSLASRIANALATARTAEWQPVEANKPPIQIFTPGQGWSEKQYVLAVDAQGRMSIGYAVKNSGPRGYSWVFAKQIGPPTHFTFLPDPPEVKQ
jgi:hypothetical protein